MKLITSDDIIDVLYRIRLKGPGFILSKFSFDPNSRTRSSFNYEERKSSNWWNIPAVRNRWNTCISGNPDFSFVDYLLTNHLANRKNLRLLSPGSGVSTSELKFASYPVFDEITCIDLAEKPLKLAEVIASEKGLRSLVFKKGDFNKMELPQNHYDIVLFNSSLHHFKNVEDLLINKISGTLKPDGILIINEYVGPNRLQWNKNQLKIVNKLLANDIPEKFKTRYRSSLKKRRVSGPGLLRMIISDPSEAVDSESIIAALRKGFIVLEEKNLGGNLLMPLLKDIAFHFEENDPQVQKLLEFLFEAEDQFLLEEPSDNIFGIYKKKLNVC